jgi:hypothetical protein
MILKLILILCTKSYYIIINEMRLNKCFYKKVYENIKDSLQQVTDRAVY